MKARSTIAAWLASTALTAVFGLALAQSPGAKAPAAAPRAPSDALPVPPPPNVVGKAWILMDYASGNVLAGENIDMPVEPASITKVMTSYVIAAEMASGKIKPTDPVLMSENAWRKGGAGTDGSYSGFEVNKTAPLEQMEIGMVVQSGNDAAIALAEHVAGSTEAFAALMNMHAERIGMKNTNFVNPHGLPDEGHVSTVRDLAILGRALIRDYPKAYSYNKIKSFTVGPITQPNRNLLLWRDASVDGIKTGHTSSAGYGLMASAKRGDQRLISVVVGSTSEKQRADDSQALLNWGFRFFETHKLFDAGKPVTTQKVWKGAENQVQLGIAAPMLVSIKRGRYDQLRPVMELPKTLVAPIAKGQEIGTVRVTLDGKVVAQRPLIALQAVEEAGFFKRLWHELLMWWES